MTTGCVLDTLAVASNKSQRYEELRSHAIDDRQAPRALSAVVLVRQGMSAWMQLRKTEEAAPRTGIEKTERSESVFLAPKHSEILSVLTGLVVDICMRKEPA